VPGGPFPITGSVDVRFGSLRRDVGATKSMSTGAKLVTRMRFVPLAGEALGFGELVYLSPISRPEINSRKISEYLSARFSGV